MNLFKKFHFLLLIFASCASAQDVIKKTTNELIASQGYPVEVHNVTTSDGYILQMHRIPRGKNGESNGKVAFLLHGLVCSSSDFIILGPDKSSGYILADEGYDVWLGNVRGNFYSRKHIKYNPDKDAEYWNFTWSEMGTSDLPTMVDYILNATGTDGIYAAAHSQGTTVFYVMTSVLPEYNAKIKVLISLSPVAYVDHLRSPVLVTFTLINRPVAFIRRLLGWHELLPRREWFGRLCSGPIGSVFCTFVLFLVCGFSWSEVDFKAAPLLFSHVPAGSAFKQLYHYSQEVRSAKFRKFDYDAEGNMIAYNSSTPPEYDLKKVTAPVSLVYALNDWVVEAKNVHRVYEQLGNPIGKVLIPKKTANHVDFVYGKTVAKFVSDYMVDLFGKY